MVPSAPVQASPYRRAFAVGTELGAPLLGVLALALGACRRETPLATPLPRMRRVDAGPTDAAVSPPDAWAPPPTPFLAVSRELLSRSADLEGLRVLIDGSLVTLDRDGLLEVGRDGTVTTRAAYAEIGDLRHAMRTPEGLLVSSPRGWVSIADGALEEPGLEDALPAASVEALAALSPTRAWLARAEDLALWADGVVRPFEVGVALEGRSLEAARVETDSGTRDVLWALTADARALRVRWDGERADAEATVRRDFVDLALTSSGRLFAVHSDGHVSSGEAPDALEPLPFVEDVASAHAAGPALWLLGRDGAWTFVDGDGAIYVDDGGARAGEPHGLSDGSLVLREGRRLERVSARWDARLDGIADGDEILARRTARLVLPEGAPAPSAILAQASGIALPSDLSARSFVLDPAALVPGATEIVVEVRFSDGTLPVTLAARVSVPGAAPTWSDTIEALYRARCSDCHDASAGARRLDSREAWIASREAILYDLRTMRMPKPPRAPLSALETARVEAWFAAGSP